MRLFNWIGRIARQPKVLLWVFLAVNLVPSVCLVFTEPVGVMGKVVMVAAPAGVYLLLFASSARAGRAELWMTPLLVFHAFQLVLFYLYGESVIATDMFLNLPTTNASEAGELLGSLWPSIVIVCVLYVPTIVLAAVAGRMKTQWGRGLRRRMVAWGTGLAVAGLGVAGGMTAWGERYSMRDDLYPVNIFYNLYYACEKWQRSEAYLETSQGFTFEAKREKRGKGREIHVLVIGEASRAGNWELLGYERPTNPRLREEVNAVVFRDALTQSNTTHKSVPLILSAADAAHYERLYTQKSVVTAFREAGFRTVFLSNQVPNRSFTDYFASEAEVTANVRATLDGGLLTVNNYDEAMLPIARECIDSLEGDLFIVMHTYGSHFNYRERYPEGFGPFKPDEAMEIEWKNKRELVNAYDNSVMYTDRFLAEVIEMLRESGAAATLVYTPDHGEDLLDDRRRKFLHASPIPTYYQVHIPMLVWVSEGYEAERPGCLETTRGNSSRAVSTRVVFHTLLDLAGIQTPWRDSTASVVSRGYVERPRMYLNDHDEPVNFSEILRKREDREMVERKRLAL